MTDPSNRTEAETTRAADSPAFRVLCHDLRQPLVVAMGYVSMLDDGSFGELSAEVRGVLRTIADRLDAMNATIDGSLDLQSIDEQAESSG